MQDGGDAEGGTGHFVSKNLTKLLATGDSISRRFAVHYTRRCVWPCHFHQLPTGFKSVHAEKSGGDTLEKSGGNSENSW